MIVAHWATGFCRDCFSGVIYIGVGIVVFVIGINSVKSVGLAPFLKHQGF